MSIPRKGTRKAHLHDKAYRYLFKVNHGDQFLFIQEDCDEPGNVLCVKMDDIYVTGPANDKGQLGLGPGDIVEVIRQSIVAGWEPSKKGPAVRLDNKFEIIRKP